MFRYHLRCESGPARSCPADSRWGTWGRLHDIAYGSREHGCRYQCRSCGSSQTSWSSCDRSDRRAGPCGDNPARHSLRCRDRDRDGATACGTRRRGTRSDHRPGFPKLLDPVPTWPTARDGNHTREARRSSLNSRHRVSLHLGVYRFGKSSGPRPSSSRHSYDRIKSERPRELIGFREH